VIVGAGNAAALALKAATATTPIVFATGDDPIQAGIVTSLNRPGGNITGVWFFSGAVLQSKQLELLRDAIPGITTIGILVNRNSPAADAQAKEAQTTAHASGQQIQIAYATSQQDLDGAFATLVQQQSGAILITGDALFTGERDRLVKLAKRYAVPTMFFASEFVAAGGLLSYGASFSEAYRLAGSYTGKLLKAGNPGELPVFQPTNRVGGQSQDCKGARAENSGILSSARRRGDRMKPKHPAGPSRHVAIEKIPISAARIARHSSR
jgi:putative ABC transport system substrate-binding protein